SAVTGRVRVMLDQVIRPGSCHAKPLLPPSAYCSISTSAPRPEQVWKAPRSLPPIASLKNTLVATMPSVIPPPSPRLPVRVARWRDNWSAAAVVQPSGPFSAPAQVGAEQSGNRVEQSPGQLVEFTGAGS